MKKFLVLVFSLLAISAGVYGNDDIIFYNDLVDSLDLIQVYSPDNLTNEVLTHRDGRIIFEKVIGRVINDAGDGEILNTMDTEHNYINYSCVDGVKEGDIILTYLLFNTENNYEDDITDRFDYIIDRVS